MIMKLCFIMKQLKKGACYLSLVGEDPDGMKGVDPKLMSNFSKTLRG